MTDRTYRFAEFELSLAEGELRSGASTVRLQEKPRRLLSLLLDHPQRLVTRQQLRERMWDSRTVVDFEQGINVAVKKVREALGDPVDNPRFIETVAKKGYRFLVPVDVVCRDAKVAATTERPLHAVHPAVSEPVAPSAIREPIAAARRMVPHRWFIAAVTAITSCTIGYGVFEVVSRPRHPAQIHSLAVLPLQNLSPDPGQEYFADGITEDVITSLAQVLPLRVISRTSVMRFKRTDKPIAQIARELGVEAIVEGSVTRSGNRVSVTVQLIDATEDRHLWAQRYERGLEDIMAIEAELSRAIVSQVSGTLSSQHVKARPSPPDPEVYQLCLMGRYFLNKRTMADLAKAEEYFQKAAGRDPQYAPAYAGLADVYALLPNYEATSVLDSFSKAVAAARHALELDDTSAEAHATLGLVGVNENPEWKLTEPEFRRALELNPNYAMAHLWFAFYLFFSDRRNEALAEVELARQLDPLSAIINADEGHFLYATRRYEEARARLRQAIELAPNLGRAHTLLGLVELETGHPSDALREAQTGLEMDPNNPCTMGEAGYLFASAGQTADARKLLERLKDLVQRGSSFPSFEAMVEVGLGQRDEALDTLKGLAVSKIGAGLHGLGQWHAFEELSTDPRYRNLMARAR